MAIKNHHKDTYKLKHINDEECIIGYIIHSDCSEDIEESFFNTNGLMYIDKENLILYNYCPVCGKKIDCEQLFKNSMKNNGE